MALFDKLNAEVSLDEQSIANAVNFLNGLQAQADSLQTRLATARTSLDAAVSPIVVTSSAAPASTGVV